MTSRQIEKYTVYQQVLLFLVAYAQYFTTGKQLPPAVIKLKNAILGIDAITTKRIPKASAPSTKDKATAKLSMIDVILKAALLILEWAKSTNNTQLIQDFTLTKESFSGKGLKALQLAQYVFKVMSDNKAEIIANTDVTDAQITTVGTKVSAFEKLLIKPTNVRSTQSTIKALYKPAFALSEAALTSLTNLIKGNLSSNTQLILDFEKALMYHIETSHTQLLVTFKNKATGALLEGARVYIKELDKEAFSIISGFAKIEAFEAGTYHVIFSADGFTEKTQILTFKLGEKTEVVMEMEVG